MQEESYSRHRSMPVAAHVGTTGKAEIPSLALKTTFEGQENSSSGFRRTSLPPLPSPRLAQHETFGDQLSPPIAPFLASASTSDLSTISTKPLLSPLQRRDSVRHTRSTVNMRFSMSAGSSSISSPLGADLGPRGYKNSRNSSPSVPHVEHKNFPPRSSQGRKNFWSSSLSQSPIQVQVDGHPRLKTPTSKSPRPPFSTNSTPPLTRTPSWKSLSQLPPPPPQAPPPPPPPPPQVERGKTPSTFLRGKLKNESSSRKQNTPGKINTNLAQIYSKDPEDEDLGMVSFFSPISSDEEAEKTRPLRKVRNSEGPIAGTGSKLVVGKTTAGGGKDIGDEVKRDKKDKRESREGRRRVSGFGTAHFRKFWGGKDDAAQSEPKSAGPQDSPTMPLLTPVPPFLNKVVDRATSPSPFSRKKDKQEKKPKESKKERRMSKGKDVNPPSTDLRGKISNPIPHRDLLDAFPETPQYTLPTRPRDSSLLSSTPLPLSPPIPHPNSPSSPRYWLSSGTSAPPMANRTSSSMGNNRPSSLTPETFSSVEGHQSPLIGTVNLSSQYSVPLLPPSPPYTSGERNLRPLSGHVRSLSAQNTNQSPPRHSAVYNYSNVTTATSSGSKSSPSNSLIQRQEYSPQHPKPYSPDSAQDLLNVLHKSLNTVERAYNHALTSIPRELSFDDRLIQELEAVEKRLKSQTVIIAGIQCQVEERRKRRESKLRRGREVEVVTLRNDGWGESEKGSCGPGGGAVGLHEDRDPDEIGEQGVNMDGLADLGREGDLINVGEDMHESPHQDEASVIIKTSSYTDLPDTPSVVHDNENSLNDYVPNIAPLTADHADDDVEIYAADSVRPLSSSSTFTRASGVQQLPDRVSLSSGPRRPVLISRGTFGEEQRDHVATELCMTLTSEVDTCNGLATPMTLSQRHSYVQSQPLVGLGIVGSNHYIRAPSTEGLRSSTSSFSFESSDVERVAVQEMSRDNPERHSRYSERGKDGKIIHSLLPRVEEKPGIYYHKSNGSSNTINTTATGNSNYPYSLYEPSHHFEKPTSGHIHFPTPRSTNNSRNNSRANTPIHFTSSPPGSSHGRNYRTNVKEEMARERTISPEGVLMRSVRSGITIPPVQERKAVVDGVELVLI